jgi:HK97 family phage portal protein
MSLLQKIFNTPIAKKNEFWKRFNVPQTKAGIYIDHDTALQSAAVFACIRVIAEDIAKLPWHVFLRTGTNTRERQPSSQVETLLNRRPNPETKAYSFRSSLLLHAQTWGNGYAEIVRDRANRPAELWQMQSDRVEAVRSRETGRLYYDVSNSSGPNTVIDADNMFHIQSISADGIVGHSIVSLAARSIGLSISLEEFGASFFGNGAQLGGVIEIPDESTLDTEGKKNLKKTFNNTHKGPGKAFGVEILDAGMRYTPIGVEPDKGQFTESQQNQVEVICRWFRVPPHKVGHLLRMTFNNVEQLSINYVDESLIPWITNLEQEADWKLFGEQNYKNYTKINTSALLRGDAASRSAWYRAMWDMAVYSTNDILELEDRNGIGPAGDKRFVQLNLTTIDKAGEEQEKPAEPEDISAHKILIQNQLQKLIQREDNRINDLKSRYDRQEFIERISGFLGGHRIKVNQEIENRLRHALKAVGIDEENAVEAAKIYTDKHIEISRAQALKVYDNEAYLDAESRSESVAEKLIQTVLMYRKRI